MRFSDKVETTLPMLENGKDIFHCFFIENNENDIIGYAFTYFIFHTWTGKTLYLEDIYIREEYRGASIGLFVMNKLTDFAKETNCSQLNWQVLKTNKKAIDFYNKLEASIDDLRLDCCLKIEKKS